MNNIEHHTQMIDTINKVKKENQELKDKIGELERELDLSRAMNQPRQLTEEDKKRILSDLYDINELRERVEVFRNRDRTEPPTEPTPDMPLP